jgi:3-oxoacyl-[acyl-carrier protein] reductase
LDGVTGTAVIVTGGAQGIGRALALAFADHGAKVAVADLNGAKASSVTQEIERAGGTAVSVETDVSDPDSVRALVAMTIEQFGSVETLVCSAAVFSTIRMGPFEHIAPEDWERVLAVNLTGTFLCCQAVAPHMRAAQRGSIVCLSSGTVLIGRPWYAHYVASKAGVIGLTRALARELGSDGVRINALLPGSTETEVPRETVRPDQVAALIAAQSIQRRLVPADLLGVVLFLASDASAMLTGQSIALDGGAAFL